MKTDKNGHEIEKCYYCPDVWETESGDFNTFEGMVLCPECEFKHNFMELCEEIPALLPYNVIVKSMVNRILYDYEATMEQFDFVLNTIGAFCLEQVYPNRVYLRNKYNKVVGLRKKVLI